jgi:hypothetical protein
MTSAATTIEQKKVAQAIGIWVIADNGMVTTLVYHFLWCHGERKVDFFREILLTEFDRQMGIR